MQETTEQDLKERLDLISTMIAEGRRTTESWGWTIVLWGVAFYVAIAWSSGIFTGPIWGGHYFAWPVTMICTFVLTRVLASNKYKTTKAPATTIRRAIMSIWRAMGISMFVLLLPMGVSGRGDQQVYIAVIAAMLGTANAASGILLKWKAQFACAVVWWLTAVASCFGTITQSAVAFLVAIFLCQIVFGAYCMAAEARVRKLREAAHA
jgi:hypothetical protein